MASELVALREKINSLPKGEKDMLLRSLEHDTIPATLPWQHLATYRALRLECSLMGSTEEAAETFVRDYGPRKFAGKVDFVLEYLSSTRKVLRRPQVENLLVLVFRCLAADIRQRSIPVTGKTLLDGVSNMPHAVDQCYPGYAEASMLQCLA